VSEDEVTIDRGIDGSGTAKVTRVRENWFVSRRVGIPDRKDWPVSLRRTRTAGFLIIGLGFVAIVFWSDFLARRWALTQDFALYNQAWYLIAHGNLNPYSTVFGVPFIKNDAELFVWPLAALWYVWPHPQTLLWFQDVCTVLAEGVLFAWICDLAALAHKTHRLPVPVATIALAGLVMLVSSPWVLWVDSFDFHPEPVLVLFAACAARALWKGQRRAWFWAFATLLGGGIGATYLLGIGISAGVSGRRWRKPGFVLAAVGLIGLVIVERFGGSAGVSAAYGKLTGLGYAIGKTSSSAVLRLALTHPTRIMGAFAHVWRDIFADIGSGGYLGVFSPQTFGICILVLAENGATGLAGFAMPWVMNSLPVILFGILGTVGVCTWLMSRRREWVRSTGRVLLVLAVLNAVGWSVVWTPQTKSYWLHVSPGAASTLDRVAGRIPTSDEVIANQGIVGRLSSRRWVYVINGQQWFPLQSATVWFVITPGQGAEPQPTGVALGEVAYLVSVHAQVVAAQDGVYILRWRHPAGLRNFYLSAGSGVVLAWEYQAVTARAVMTGPIESWHEVAQPVPGYVVAFDYWREKPARYTGTVSLSSTLPVDVQIWDDSVNRLLGEKSVDTGGRVETVHVKYRVVANVIEPVFSGYWPFKIQQRPAPFYDQIEMRVWSPGHGKVRVYFTKMAN
jgi:hypothetical protein